jgi:hypothetical protein
MAGQSDAGIDYDDRWNLLYRLGYTSRQRGSHNIFRKSGFDLISLRNQVAKRSPTRCARSVIISKIKLSHETYRQRLRSPDLVQ